MPNTELVEKWASPQFFRQFSDAEEGFDRVLKKFIEMNEVGRKLEKAPAANLKELNDYAKALQQNADSMKALHQQTIAFQQVKKDTIRLNQSELKAMEAAANVRRASAQAIEAEAKARTANTKAADAELRAEQTRQKIQQQGTAAQLTQYNALKKAYVDASNAAKEYGVALGLNDPKFKQAAADAKKMYDILYAVESAVGQNNRGVGQYERAGAGLSNSVQQILREAPSAAVSLNTFFLAISNNLPIFFDEVQKINAAQKEALALQQEQIIVAREAATAQALQAGATAEAAAAEAALAEQTLLANAAQTKAPSAFSQVLKSLGSFNTYLTLGVLALTLYGAKIVDWVGSLFKGKDALNKLSKAEEEEFNLRKKISENYGTEAAKLDQLKAKIENIKVPMDARLQAVKDIQEQFPAYFENLKKEDILAGNVAAAYDKARESIIASARVRVFGDDLGKVEGELARIGDRLRENASAAGVELKETPGIPGITPILGPGGQIPFYKTGDKDKEGKAIRTDLITDTQKYNALLAKQAALTARIQENLPKSAVSDGIDDPKKAKTGSIPNDYYQQDIAAQRKAIEEKSKLRKADLDEDAADFKRIADDDVQSLDVRLEAYRVYLADKKAFIVEEKTAQIEAARQTIKGLQEEQGRNNNLIGGGTLGKKGNANAKERNSAITGQIKAANAEILRLTRESTTEQNIAVQEGMKFIQGIYNDDVQHRIAAINEIRAVEQTSRDEQLKANRDDLEKGLISYQVYKNREKEINAEAAASEARAVKSYLEQQIADLAAKGADVTALQRSLNDVLKQMYDADAKAFDESETRKQDSIKRTNEAAKQFAEEAARAVSAIIDASYERELQQEGEKIRIIESNKQANIDAANSEALSQADKQKKIATINAQAASQEEQIRQKENAIKRKRDIADRTAALLGIAENAAVAELGALKLGYAGIPLGILIAGIAIAQTAAVLAKPLPAYAGGTLNHPGGDALMGERGRELVNENGDWWLTADTATVYKDLAPRSKVLANPVTEQLMQQMAQQTFNVIPQGLSLNYEQKVSLDTGAVERGLRELKQAIKDKPVAHMSLTGLGVQWAVRAGQDITEYIKNSLRN